MYVRPELRERFAPMVTGWFAHRDPFAFDPPAIDYARDAYRWATGTPTIPGYLVAKAGHDLIRELGVPSIREHNVRLTTRLTEAALERGWTVNTPRERAAPHRLGRHRRAAGRARAARAAERRILVDHRPGCGLRVSAHFYTTDEEIERFLAAMDELRQTLERPFSFPRGWEEESVSPHLSGSSHPCLNPAD